MNKEELQKLAIINELNELNLEIREMDIMLKRMADNTTTCLNNIHHRLVEIEMKFKKET